MKGQKKLAYRDELTKRRTVKQCQDRKGLKKFRGGRSKDARVLIIVKNSASQERGDKRNLLDAQITPQSASIKTKRNYRKAELGAR